MLIAIALLLLIPIATLFLECLAALLPGRKTHHPNTAYPNTEATAPPTQVKKAILMPAHNEALGIAPVLAALTPQLQPQDRLIVIADNCTDNTASIARDLGATVIERSDTERRGKGYALDYGMQFLATDPPDVVLIIDADCEVQADTLDKITQQVLVTGRPVQALYLMEQPPQPTPKDAVSALAFLVKNWVRPQGETWLGIPCPLAGTGMAFPWTILQQVKLASGNLVEDMQLGIDLAIAGHAPLFYNDTQVIGKLPQQQDAATSQRTRWEHGHLQTMRTQVPTLLKAALMQKRFDLFGMALDLCIPPLSLLVMIWLFLAGLTVIAGTVGASWHSAYLVGLEGILLFLAIFSGWLKFGRRMLPPQTLLAIPLYVLWKIPLYFAFLVRPQTRWVRTERDGASASQSVVKHQ